MPQNTGLVSQITSNIQGFNMSSCERVTIFFMLDVKHSSKGTIIDYKKTFSMKLYILFINLGFFDICVEKRNLGYLTCHSAQSSAKKVQLFGIIVVFSWLKWSDLLSEQKKIGQNYVNKQLTIWTSFYLSALLQYISIFRL